MTYEALAKFAQQGGSLYILFLFVSVCIYALWPKNKAKFEQAANMPLDSSNDDTPIHTEKL